MKNFKLAFAAPALIALLVAGCGKIYDYELERLAEICGGYDQLKSVWMDASTPRAYCADGRSVKTKEDGASSAIDREPR